MSVQNTIQNTKCLLTKSSADIGRLSACTLYIISGQRIGAMLKATIANSMQNKHHYPCISLCYCLIFNCIGRQAEEFFLGSSSGNLKGLDRAYEVLRSLMGSFLLFCSGLAPIFRDTQYFDTKIQQCYMLVREDIADYMLEIGSSLKQEIAKYKELPRINNKERELIRPVRLLGSLLLPLSLQTSSVSNP